MDLRWIRSILDVGAAEWNRLAETAELPFLEWEWLHAMEASGSATEAMGWYPLHCTVWDGRRLVAAAPFYGKTHSMGEFVWDHAWAEVAGQLGIPYYPKLVGVVPATPAEGYRFLIDPELDEVEVTLTILAAAADLAERNKFGGVHILFADPSWTGLAEKAGMVPWLHQHYRWTNDGFRTFEDYLSSFTKNQRKNIRKERERMAEQSLRLEVISGSSAPAWLFDLMFDYYTITNDKFVPWDARYVNLRFFRLLEKEFRHRLHFVAAFDGDAERPIALSMLVRKKDRVWGRYWGTCEDRRDLHFNACYYRPIQWCVEEGIRDFDPGAGSPHKIRRGFRAVENTSYHLFFDNRMRDLLEANISRINAHERAAIHELNAELPFKDRRTGIVAD